MFRVKMRSALEQRSLFKEHFCPCNLLQNEQRDSVYVDNVQLSTCDNGFLT